MQKEQISNLTMKQKLGLVFDDDLSTQLPILKNTVDYTIVALIIISAAEVFLSTFDSISSKYGYLLNLIDWFTTVFFSIEIALRIWTADLLDERYKGLRGRVRYCLSFYGLVDLISVIPFYINLVLPTLYTGLKILRILRLLRLFRYMKSSRLMFAAIYSKRKELTTSFALLILLTAILSAMLYFVEHEAQPVECENGWKTFVWAFAKYFGDPGKIADFTLETPAANVIAFFVGLLGIAIFAVPTGLISSGFTEASEEEKRRKELQEFRQRIRKAFRRSLNKATRYRVPPRYMSIITLQAKKGMAENDIIDTVAHFPEFRLRNLATSQATSEHPQDRLVIEMLPLDRQTVDGYMIEKTTYGIKIDRKSRVTIIAPTTSECCISFFAYYLAQFGGFNLVSREYTDNVDEPVSYYNVDDNPPQELRDFINDIAQLSPTKEHWNIALISSYNMYKTEIHLVHKVKQGENTTTSVLDEEQFQQFYAQLEETMKDQHQLLCDMDEIYRPASLRNIVMKTGGGKENSGFTVRISYRVTTWTDSCIPIALDFAKVIRRHLEAEGKREFTEHPGWKLQGYGFGMNEEN